MTAVTDQTRSLIAQSKSLPPENLKLSDIQQRSDFQKRSASTENKATRSAIREKEAEVVSKLIADLKASPKHQSEPVTVCKVDGELILVDGHHRYQSYAAAQRDTIPARVLGCSESEAHMLATMLNTYNSTIPVGKEERHQMVWREVTRLHDGVEWSGNLSARKMADLTGLSPKTLDRMVVARKKHGEDAVRLTWKQARRDTQERCYSSEERLVGWLTTLDKINAESDHEIEVLIELIRAWKQEYCSKEELAERFVPLLEDPEALHRRLMASLREF